MALWRQFAAKWARPAPAPLAAAMSSTEDGPRSEATDEQDSDMPGDLVLNAKQQNSNPQIESSASRDVITWDDALDLGSAPADPLILDLVTNNAASVRLRNAIIVAAGGGSLPLIHVSDYAAAGGQAADIMMRYVANLGRKSATELDVLIGLVKPMVPFDAEPGSAAKAFDREPPKSDALRIVVAAYFETATVEEAISSYAPPARLLPALERLGFAKVPLADLIRAYPNTSDELKKLANMGRTTVAAARKILADIIEEELRRRGLTDDQITSAVALLLDGALLDRRSRRSLADALGVAGDSSPSAPPPAAPAGPPVVAATPTEIIDHLLEKLGTRERDIVMRRFGFSGSAETLEDVGRYYGVTRERIRQIEAKTLRILRQRAKRHITVSLLHHGGELWAKLSGNLGYVLEQDLWHVRRMVPPVFDLALELSGLKLEDWLSSYAQAFEHGWVGPSDSTAALDAVRERLISSMRNAVLPCPLTSLLDPSDLDKAPMVVALTGGHLYAGYLLEERPGRRLRRALGLHAILAADGGVAIVTDLLARYRNAFAGDFCSARDATIVMEAQQQLFLEITEGAWAAIGPAGSAQAVVNELSTDPNRDLDGEDIEEEGAGADERYTIARAIEEELRRVGPMRISEIIDRASGFLPPGRSTNSVGPILLNNKDTFTRALPGVYALIDQVPSPEQLMAAPPAYIFEEEQIRIYVLARRAGEPWGGYPLWLPESEYLWCTWARRHADSALLESLLAVARIEAWPAVDDHTEWAEFALQRGRFSIDLLQAPDAIVLPDLDRVFAACRFLQAYGRIGWISANRILYRRVIDHSGAGLLALLVALGAVRGDSADWQAPHFSGPGLHDLIRDCERARPQQGKLIWDSAFGQNLRAAASAAPLGSQGWVGGDMLLEMFGAKSAVATDAIYPLDPLEQLLAERASAATAGAVQETMRAFDSDRADVFDV